jgi:hypothetical protein
VTQKACVYVPSRDRPRRVDALWEEAKGTRDVETGDRAVALTQEAVLSHAYVVSGDRPRRVNAEGSGLNGTRGVEAGKGAVRRTQEAVSRKACVAIGSRDRPSRVDAGASGANGARHVEAGDRAVTVPVPIRTVGSAYPLRLRCAWISVRRQAARAIAVGGPQSVERPLAWGPGFPSPMHPEPLVRIAAHVTFDDFGEEGSIGHYVRLGIGRAH